MGVNTVIGKQPLKPERYTFPDTVPKLSNLNLFHGRIPIMNLLDYLGLVFVFSNALPSVAWFWNKDTSGTDAHCALEVPSEVKKQKEPLGEPLIIYVDVKVLGVRDIPDRGGSYSVDIK